MPRENNSNKHNCHLFFHNAFNPIAELSKLSSSDALNVDELRFIKVAGQHTDTFLGEKNTWCNTILSNEVLSYTNLIQILLRETTTSSKTS